MVTILQTPKLLQQLLMLFHASAASETSSNDSNLYVLIPRTFYSKKSAGGKNIYIFIPTLQLLTLILSPGGKIDTPKMALKAKIDPIPVPEVPLYNFNNNEFELYI